MSTLAPPILIGSSSPLQVMSTSIAILDGFEIQQDPARDCGVSCPWVSRKIPNFSGRNVVTTVVLSFLNRSSLFLQVTRTAMKAKMCLHFGLSPTTEKDALECIKNHCIML